MKLRGQVINLARLYIRNRFNFCKKPQKTADNKVNDTQQQKKENKIIKFLKDGWRETFPDEEDEIRSKYEKAKKVKRYTEEQLRKIQQNIPEYQRKAIVETETKAQQKKSKFKISNAIPQSVKKKMKESHSYKQYSQFKQNFKQFVNTSDSAAVNLGTTAIKGLTSPSNQVRATEMMRKYDKEFSLIDLQSQSTYIFRDVYHLFLSNNAEGLEILCGGQALDLLQSLIKINQTKKVRPKYSELLQHKNSRLKKTVYSQNSLPSFQFNISVMEVYCMIDMEGKIVDGDEERIMSSTFQFLLKYSGEHIGELGHPWQVIEFRKIDEIKYLI